MRSMLLLALLLLAGCKTDWTGPDLSCMFSSEDRGCPPPATDGVATALMGDTMSVPAAAEN